MIRQESDLLCRPLTFVDLWQLIIELQTGHRLYDGNSHDWADGQEGAPGGIPTGRDATGASAAKRDVHVVARGRSSNQATSRSRLIAAAVATCCTCVFGNPR